jgi:molybdate transport system substrate-binding protein
MAPPLFVLSAGVAKAVVQALAPAFEQASGAVVNATFGAVGAMREKWAAGAPCDVLILSAALLDVVAQEGGLDAGTRVSLGRVGTGIAVRTGATPPAIADAGQLKATLVASTSLYLPDPERATAGIHCVDVLRRLGILEAMRTRLRPYPNGAIAMSELAANRDDANPVGCTQVTEILYTRGVALVGRLPAGFELNTEYAAAVVSRAREPDLARRFTRALGGDATLAARRLGGFDV